MKVFVSLPITGKVEAARKEAARVKQELERIGYEVITPFECAPDPDRHISYYMGRCIEALLQCDRICQAPECDSSNGCAVEAYTAKMYGIPSVEYPMFNE